MKKKYKFYTNIINKIEKIRSKNNVNWMNILKLAFKTDPKSVYRKNLIAAYSL